MAGTNYSSVARVEGYKPGVGNEILHEWEQVACNESLSFVHTDLTHHLKLGQHAIASCRGVAC